MWYFQLNKSDDVLIVIAKLYCSIILTYGDYNIIGTTYDFIDSISTINRLNDAVVYYSFVHAL